MKSVFKIQLFPIKNVYSFMLGMQLPDEDRNMMISRSSGRSGFIYMVNV